MGKVKGSCGLQLQLIRQQAFVIRGKSAGQAFQTRCASTATEISLQCFFREQGQINLEATNWSVFAVARRRRNIQHCIACLR